MDRCLSMREVNHVMTCLTSDELETVIYCLDTYVKDREPTDITDGLVDSINSIVNKLEVSK